MSEFSGNGRARLTSHLPLHPGPPSAWVCPLFYGGPNDGDVGVTVQSEELRSSIRCVGGAYSLQGFRNSGEAAGVPRKWCMDYAIYEWGQ